MNNKILVNAIFMAISEDVLKQLEYDESIGRYVWPEGAIFSIEPALAKIAANELGIEMKHDEHCSQDKKTETKLISMFGRIVGSVEVALENNEIGRWWEKSETRKFNDPVLPKSIDASNGSTPDLQLS